MPTSEPPISEHEIQNRLRHNVQLLHALFESFSNRNSREIKASAETGIAENLKLIARFARQIGYSPGSAEPLLDDPAKTEDANHKLILLISRIERYERDFSGCDDELPGLLQPTSPPKAPKPPKDDFERYPTVLYPRTGGASFSTDDNKRRDSLWKAWIRAMEQTHEIAESLAKMPADDIGTVVAHYLLFRAIRERISSFYSTSPQAMKLEKSEHHLRGLLYMEASHTLRPLIESRLQRTTLFRELAIETKRTQYLRAAIPGLIELMERLTEALQEEVVTLRLPQDGEANEWMQRELATLFPRCFNDLGRLCEAYAVLMAEAEEDRASGRKRSAPVFEFAVDLDNPQTRPGAAQDEFEVVAERVRELIQFLHTVLPPHDPNMSLEFFRGVHKELEGLASNPDRVNRPAWHSRLVDLEATLNSSTSGTGKEDERQDWQRAYEFTAGLYGLIRPDDRLEDMLPDHKPSKGCRGRRNPKAYLLVHNRGRIYARLGRLADAVDDYRTSLHLNPEYATGHENFGHALVQLGELVVAERHFAEARLLYEQRANRRTDSLEANLGELVVSEANRQDELVLYLTQRPAVTKAADEIIILKRWNSFTPSLPSKPRSLGGGYFMVLGGKGIVIDPGYDFIHNLGQAGFSMNDIDAIAITHLHVDHAEDLENLLLLIFERQKRTGNTSRTLKILATPPTLDRIRNRVRSLSPDPDEMWKFIKWVRLHHDKQTDLFPRNPIARVKIKATPALHMIKEKDLERLKGVPDPSSGLRFSVARRRSKENPDPHPFEIGLTSDTRWDPSLPEALNGCDVVIAHLGEVYSTDIDASGYIRDARSIRASRNHLGLSGVYTLMREMEKPPRLLLLGEFGEEVGPNRVRVADRLRTGFVNHGMDTYCLAADVGLRVRLGLTQSEATEKTDSIRVHCPYCGASSWRPFQEMKELLLDADGGDEGIRYHCSRHHPDHVRQVELTGQAQNTPTVGMTERRSG